jgi:NADPH:quinone reductase-like Zn-dependent oxidoreductase
MTPEMRIPPMMKAWVCQAYGGPDVLALEDRPVPQPKDNEVLVRICATSVSSGDMRVRSLKLPPGFGLIGRLALGLTKPRRPILGTEFSGVIAAAGKDVTGFKPGDEVFGFPGSTMGCHAEYRAMAVSRPIALKPQNLSHEEAASLSFGPMTALHFLRKADVKAGERLLVIGASGAVGGAMVQLGKHMGMTVTGLTSTGNVDMVRSLGADKVIDYTKEDFTKGGETFDVIADTVDASSFASCLAVLNENGRYLAIAGGVADLLARPKGTKKSIGGPASEDPKYFSELAKLAASGALKPVIDRVFGFEQMRDAHAYVDTGRKRGSVVVRVG